MTKKVYPNELAEIVTTLLIKPELVGELETEEKFISFMDDIGSVVAKHCGGVVTGISKPEVIEDLLSSIHHMPMLSVSPCPSLADINNNVWTNYDPEGWEDEAEVCFDGIEIPDRKQISQFRNQVQDLLKLHNPESYVLSFCIRDYHTDIDDATVEKSYSTEREALKYFALYLCSRIDWLACPHLSSELAYSDNDEKAKYIGGLPDDTLVQVIEYQVEQINTSEDLEATYSIQLEIGAKV
ncbi:hypothetical protein F7Q91_02800 [Vibrio chagasii]|uniref:Uncharacterized protein n=1 Tax=Vibrio chagasii TaxID=170679 RepID=A0A7V7NWU2_9VIBR|nr:hypothetical protein [Vibrio chagasii]KAB0482349.1 hypothetical protein F7Q91_02800 [Vibrio chagasii]